MTDEELKGATKATKDAARAFAGSAVREEEELEEEQEQEQSDSMDEDVEVPVAAPSPRASRRAFLPLYLSVLALTCPPSQPILQPPPNPVHAAPSDRKSVV